MLSSPMEEIRKLKKPKMYARMVAFVPGIIKVAIGEPLLHGHGD